MVAIIALAAVCSVARTDVGKIARSRDAVRAFRHEHPCPGGKDKGSRTRCVGYVVDHVTPLCAGGKDAPENMAWQTRADAAAKDRAEVALCRFIAIECGRPWRKRR